MLKERAGGLDYALYADNGAGQPPAGYVDVSKTDYSTLGDPSCRSTLGATWPLPTTVPT